MRRHTALARSAGIRSARRRIDRVQRLDCERSRGQPERRADGDRDRHCLDNGRCAGCTHLDVHSNALAHSRGDAQRYGDTRGDSLTYRNRLSHLEPNTIADDCACHLDARADGQPHASTDTYPSR
jgi:hypothetical protein